MEETCKGFSIEIENSTYFGKSEVDNNHNSDNNLDHLFNNVNNNYDNNVNNNYDNNVNNNYDDNYDDNTETSLEHKDNKSYTYSQSSNNSFNNSYNNSPLNNRTKSPLISNQQSPFNSQTTSPFNNPYINSTSPYKKNNANINSTYIAKCQDSLEQRIRKLNNFITSLSKQKESALKEAEKAQIKIKEAAKKMHQIVDEDKEKLLNESELYAENTKKELHKMSVEVDKNLKASEELLIFLHDLKTSGENEEKHVTSFSNLMKELERVDHNVTIGSLKFSVCEVNKLNLIGKVSVSDLDTSDPYLEEPMRVGLIEGDQMVAGITTSQDKIYVIRELLPNVEIYNTDLSRHKMLKLEGLRKPSDIAADSLSCHVYISDGSGCVFKLHPETNVLNKLAIDVSGDPQGLHVVPSGAINAGNILVTCTDSKQVKEYTSHGDFVRCIKFQQDVLSPWHCVSLDGVGWGGKILGDKRFVVSHGYESGKLHRICSINEKGRTLSSFGLANGSGNMKLDTPNRIAVDKFGYVFVADRNNDRVVLLSPNLLYVRDIINKFQKIKQPKRLYLDNENGWLYVGLVNGNVHIFQLCEGTHEEC